MSHKIQVIDNESLERDKFSNAILNRNVDSYNSAINRKRQLIENKKTIEQLKDQIEELLEWKNQIVNILEKNNINNTNDG
jgi:hypothetical protein